MYNLKKIIKEEMDSFSWVNDLPAVGDTFEIPKSFYRNGVTIPQGKITINSIATIKHLIVALTTLEPTNGVPRPSTALTYEFIKASIDDGYFVKI